MLTYFLNERRRLKLVGSGAFSPGHFSDFNSLKFLFVGLVVQKGYWPVPFSSDEALQVGGSYFTVNFYVVVDMKQDESKPFTRFQLRKCFYRKKYIYYGKSDRFP